MVQGTASSAGKSVLVAALCRVFAREGVRVAPFKAQNMSNNSFVDADGREMGRAQVEQAAAARIAPRAEMNPILLKPEADHRSQLVVLGRPQGIVRGSDFLRRKRELWPVVCSALELLLDSYDLVLIEGAGSPAEINLRDGDIVNMRVALHASAPVLLVGDIDRGGVFAHLVGTLQLLQPAERALVKGLVVNKFRGSRALLQPGISWLEEYTGLPVLGVVPWLDRIGVAEEDAVALEAARGGEAGELDVAVIKLPHVANFDDLDALAAEPGVAVRFVDRTESFGEPSLVVLPGTKSTVADLRWLEGNGLAERVLVHADSGGAVIGICGGYQMLGREVLDLNHIESRDQYTYGLGLLDVTTVFEPEKETSQVEATVAAQRGLLRHAAGAHLRGYEIHMGRTAAPEHALRVVSRSGERCDERDGAVSATGNVFGTYIHGLFDNDSFRRSVLAALGHEPAGRTWSREAAYERLADHVAAALDMRTICALAGIG
jgi:adenosylcobyric acid synthase